VLTRPCVIGKLACGGLRHRDQVLSVLHASPEAQTAEHADVMRFVEGKRLHGRGIGWIDAHLLAPARLAGSPRWTLDRRRAHVGSSLDLAFDA
jgi:hypothetical protein